MAGSRKKDNETPAKLRPPTTPEEQENKLISLAVGLAEKQLREGTASPTTINHYLKLASVREQREAELQLRQMEINLELSRAKTDQIRSQSNSEELYEKALAAFSEYSGKTTDEGL